MMMRVVYLLIPTSNHNCRLRRPLWCQLYIFWFLHQTTTGIPIYCDGTRCISFDSYIKPQHWIRTCVRKSVVYLLIPTSNHNTHSLFRYPNKLYIFWFLHQTTTYGLGDMIASSCISFDSYIKPQLGHLVAFYLIGCISFDSYIKPQLFNVWLNAPLRCISFDSYIKPQLNGLWYFLYKVVYLLIPTSNHNWYCS